MIDDGKVPSSFVLFPIEDDFSRGIRVLTPPGGENTRLGTPVIDDGKVPSSFVLFPIEDDFSKGIRVLIDVSILVRNNAPV